jgi:ankyrin repeat protein
MHFSEPIPQYTISSTITSIIAMFNMALPHFSGPQSTAPQKHFSAFSMLGQMFGSSLITGLSRGHGAEKHHIRDGERTANESIQYPLQRVMDILKLYSLLLYGGVDINFKDPDGCSPLALAALHGHLALVKLLISLGACQLSCDRFRRRPIANAAFQGHHGIEDYLLKELKEFPHFYPKLTIQADIQWMLLYAAERGDELRVKCLVSIGADVNFQFDVDGCTPLYGAVVFAPYPLDVVKLLLELGANPNIGTRSPPTTRKRRSGYMQPQLFPIDRAMQRDESYHLLLQLLQSGAEFAGQVVTEAIKLQKSAELRLLVQHGAKLYSRNWNNEKPIFRRALESSCEEIRNVILERGFTLETPDPDSRFGRHPLERVRRNR